MRARLVLLLIALVTAGCVAPPEDAGDDLTPADDAQGGFSDTDVFPGAYDTSSYRSWPLEEGPYTEFEWEVVRLASDLDGATIAMIVTRPLVAEGERLPVVVQASPYFESIDLLERAFDEGLVDTSGDWLMKHGYARAFLAVRGTAGSGGCMDFFGPREQHDLDQAITWLGTQDWSNGNVGMWGGSYDGGTQWEVAAQGNPHLKTIVPVSGVVSPFDLFYRNGTIVNRGLWHSADYQVVQAYQSNNPLTGRSADDTVDGLCPEVVEGIRASLASSTSGEHDPYGFWAERELRDAILANYKGSVFLIHGLQDWNVVPGHAYPFVNDLEAQGAPVKHLLGQWMHMAPDTPTGVDSGNLPYIAGPRLIDFVDGHEHVRWDFAEILLHWYDYWLKEDTTVDLGPRVQVEDNLANWRSETRWPPADATPRAFHLADDGKLADEPAGAKASIIVAADPVTVGSFAHTETVGAVTACAACATFTTTPFDDEFRFAGLPKVHVTVTPQGPGGVLYGYLHVVAPDGSAQRVAWGSIDLRFADGGDEAKDVAAGKSIVARLQLEPVDVVVPESHRLLLVLTAGGTYGDHATAVDQPVTPPWPLMVEVGGEQSVLEVLTFERGAEDLFAPPR